MTSPFENLTGPGKPLRAEPPDASEFAGLQQLGLARLKDAQTGSLALESRFATWVNTKACWRWTPVSSPT